MEGKSQATAAPPSGYTLHLFQRVKHRGLHQVRKPGEIERAVGETIILCDSKLTQRVKKRAVKIAKQMPMR